MKLIRSMFLLLAICLPTSWTLAHAADEGAAGTSGETKEAKPKKGKKEKKKKEGGDMGDMKMDK
jgi:uncharacterized FlgJ-related protein